MTHLLYKTKIAARWITAFSLLLITSACTSLQETPSAPRTASASAPVPAVSPTTALPAPPPVQTFDKAILSFRLKECRPCLDTPS